MDSIDYGCYYFPVKEFSAICPICSKVHVFAYQKQMDFKEKGDRYVIERNFLLFVLFVQRYMFLLIKNRWILKKKEIAM